MRIDRDIGSINLGSEGLGFTWRGISPITFSLSRSIEGMPRLRICNNLGYPDEDVGYLEAFLGPFHVSLLWRRR